MASAKVKQADKEAAVAIAQGSASVVSPEDIALSSDVVRRAISSAIASEDTTGSCADAVGSTVAKAAIDRALGEVDGGWQVVGDEWHLVAGESTSEAAPPGDFYLVSERFWTYVVDSFPDEIVRRPRTLVPC